MGQYLAVSGVFILRIAPAIILGPIAGVVADRLDRRKTMIFGDLLRFALFVSIPLVGQLWWMYIAIVLIECVSLFWNPAKDATVPNLVPPKRLELANQLNLIGSYGTAPIAALSSPACPSSASRSMTSSPGSTPRASTWPSTPTPRRSSSARGSSGGSTFPPRAAQEELKGESVVRSIADGLLILKERPFVRGLIAGMLGAFAGGGLVIGLATRFVGDMGAGAPGYGLLFVSVFSGMALGLILGPRVLRGFSRARLFGAALTGAGIVLLVLALVPTFLLSLPLALLLGAFVGVGWVVGYTLIGLTVEDEIRGRTFALVQSLDGVVLVVVLAVAPLVAAMFDTLLGLPVTVNLGPLELTYTGAMITYLLAGLAMIGSGVWAWRSMNDRPGVSVLAELREVRRRRTS